MWGEVAEAKSGAGGAWMMDGCVLTAFQRFHRHWSARARRAVQLGACQGCGTACDTREHCLHVPAWHRQPWNNSGKLSPGPSPRWSLCKGSNDLQRRTARPHLPPDLQISPVWMLVSSFFHLVLKAEWGKMCQLLGSGKLQSLASYSKVWLSNYILGAYP